MKQINLRRGINIGDHFEQTLARDADFSTIVKDWYYDKIKELGFDHVRIPAKWDIHTDDAHDYIIDSNFLAEYTKVVDKFINMGLSVIVNIHHFREAMDNPKANEQKIYSIWEQLGAHFKDYDDKLIFEVMNEPTWRTTAEEWNDVQQKAVAVIRKTNPTRLIEVCGIDYSGLFAMDKMIPPENDENLIGTFHYYFPLEFTHQGAAWSPTYKDIKDVRWLGSDEEIEDIRKNIVEHAVAWSKKYDLPVNLGEFGAYKPAPMADRAAYTAAVCNVCEANNISWTYWEFNRGFGIFNHTEDSPNTELINALVGRE